MSRRMSRQVSRLVWLACTAALLAGGGATAQQKNPYRNYNEQKFVDNMQTAGRNYAAVNDFVAKGDYASAKAQLTRAREQLAVTVQFWRDVHHKDDAVAMLRRVLAGLDDLDKTLSAESIDSAAVKASVSRINEACQSCHTVYRERDASGKAYRVKESALR